MTVHLITSISRFLVDVLGDAPTSGIPIGSRAYSLETSLWYIFDGAAWSELTLEHILVISDNELAAINAADTPSAANPFITESAQTTAIDAALSNLLSALPAVDPAVAGALWNNAGVLTVSAG